MNPRTKTKPFPGEENLPSELLDTAPGRPALLQGGHDLPPPETPVPDGYFDDLLDAAAGTPAIPERPDSAGAKNARFSGGAGVPQRARDKTLPTGEVLVEPLPIAEVRAHALATANPSREVDLDAFVRNAEVRRAATVPALRVREAEAETEALGRRRRGLVALASGALVAALLASTLYIFTNKNERLSPTEPAAASASAAALVVAPPVVAPPSSPAPSGLVSAGVPSAAASPSSASPSVALASPPRTAAPPVVPAPLASAAASAPVATPPRASGSAPSDITHNIN